MKRSPGWVVQGLGTAALLALAGASLWLPGWVLGHVSDWIGAVS